MDVLILHSFETLRGGLCYYIFFVVGCKIFLSCLRLGTFKKNLHYSVGTIQLFIGINYF